MRLGGGGGKFVKILSKVSTNRTATVSIKNRGKVLCAAHKKLILHDLPPLNRTNRNDILRLLLLLLLLVHRTAATAIVLQTPYFGST